VSVFSSIFFFSAYFARSHKAQKTPINFVMSLRLFVRRSACFSAPTGRTVVDFYARNFYINQSRNTNLVESRKNIRHVL
jgi:hypothetical protein